LNNLDKLIRPSISRLEKILIEKKQGRSSYSILPVEIDGSIIPFDVKKTYFVIGEGTDSVSGQHSHIDEKEFFLVLKGNAKFVSIDSDDNEYEIELNETEGLYVPNLIWHGFSHLSADCVIIAYSSEHYRPDRSDYIEDRNIYLSIKK
jgi:dTDP-4-dehydrorhamnose 3,5-epimerase-like enzyme